MGSFCRECAAGLAHCHGTVITHSLRRSECTDAECDGPELVLHSFVVDCEVIGCACAQPIGSSDALPSVSAG